MPDDHKCLHEADLAVLLSDLPEIKKDIKEVLKIIGGNGGKGIKTQVELNKASLTRAWWFIGGLGLVFLGVGAKAVLF